MKKHRINQIFVFLPDHQFYLTGFKALIYSRPIIVHLDFEKTSIIVPGLEETHAKEHAHVDEVFVYYEHPTKENAKSSHLDWIEVLINSAPKNGLIGVDLSNIPGEMLVYFQENDIEIVDVGTIISKMRFIKDEEEIKALEKAAELVNLAVSKSLEKVKPGITEIEIDAAGNIALFEATSEKYSDATLDLTVMTPSGIRRSVMPHVFSNTRKIQEGDVIIHTRQVGLNGYRAELERTVIVGNPSPEQKRAFAAAIEAQQRAMEFIKPGVRFSEVDSIARSVFEREGLEQYAIHRTGHGIGVSAHEPPFLRYDHHGFVEEGMVFSIEPGIYIPGVGGFRHSDTVVVTGDGCKVITEFPRDMATLTLLDW